MEISIGNNLNKKLINEASMRRYFPKDWQKIQRLLSILSASTCLEEIPNVKPYVRHKLTGDREGQWAFWINTNLRLVVEPLDGDSPKTITHIKIVDIVDYH